MSFSMSQYDDRMNPKYIRDYDGQSWIRTRQFGWAVSRRPT
jgi:hypothetical protein